MLKPELKKAFYLWNSLLFISIPSATLRFLPAPAVNPEYPEVSRAASCGELPIIPPPDSGKVASYVSSRLNKHASRNGVFRSPKVKLNKKGVKFVKNYIRKSNKRLYKIKKRSTIPFEIIDSVFDRYGLPAELRYLAVVESELKPSATSHVGARGPWQLMPETAEILGLKVDETCDERTDYYKSTPAAARYLKDLYAEFGDWLLVLAAYNGGPGPVYHAIRRSGSRNFWVLQRNLPAETRVHVKRFIATHYYFEGHGSVTTLTRAERISYLRTLRRFENAHPEVESATRMNKYGRRMPAAGKLTPAIQPNSIASTPAKTAITSQANGQDFVSKQAPETENDKFKRVMKNAESAILQSSAAAGPAKRK